MIKFNDIIGDMLEIPYFEIKSGKVYKIIFHSATEKNEFIDLVMGIKAPKKGEISLFDKDMAKMKRDVYYNAMKKLALIWENGGVISNLKVWENIALPLWFHNGIKPAAIEERVIKFYKNFYMDVSFLSDYMGRLPGTLPAFDKRLICLIRSFLMEPEIIVYDDIFTGIKMDRAEKLMEATEGFHRENPHRTSVYLASTLESLKDIKADYNIFPEEKGFKIWRS